MEQQNEEIAVWQAELKSRIQELAWAFPADGTSRFDPELAGPVFVERWRQGNSPEAITKPLIELWHLEPDSARIVTIASAQHRCLRTNTSIGGISLVAVFARPQLWIGVQDNGYLDADPRKNLSAATAGSQILSCAAEQWGCSLKIGFRCMWAVLETSSSRKTS